MKSILAATTVALCGVLGASHAADSTKAPAYVSAAVADTSRPDADRQRDTDRKPDQVLAFAGVKPGDSIGELQPGGGYYTRLLCKVAGDTGRVYTIRVLPPVPLNRPTPEPPKIACTNLIPTTLVITDLKMPADLDVVWTSENYHDLHIKVFGPADMKAFNTAIFKALKPGGIFIIEDHAAQSGSGARDSDTLHRIDPELVKQEVTSVGFEFVGASNVLQTSDDPMTVRVFDLKGKTNKFLFKFRKPKK